MKKLFLFLAVLIAGSASQTALATEIGDTLVLEKVDKVRIETRDTVQRIVINGVKDDPYFHYSQRISIPDTSAVRRKMPNLKDFNKVVIKGNDDGKTPKVEGSAHLYVGMGTMTGAPDGYSLWPAFEFGVGGTADWHPFGKKNVWSTGLLLGFRTCHVKSNRYLAKDDMGVVSFVPYDAATQKKTHSSLSIFSLQVPLTPINADGREVGGVTMRPSSVQADVQLARGLTKKVVSIKAVTAGAMHKGLVLSGVKVDPVKIEIAGNEETLAQITSVDTEPVNLSDIGKSTTRKTKLVLPEGVTVTNREVTVYLDIKSAEEPQDNSQQVKL